MFPNADYICSAAELAAWQADPAQATILADSVQPVLDAGLLCTIDPAAGPVFDDVFTYHATPSHSLDHASIALVSNGEYALFGGDVLHNPIQARHPHWSSVFCEDKPRATQARAWALDWCATHDALYFSSHFADTSVGRIRRADDGSYDWQCV